MSESPSEPLTKQQDALVRSSTVVRRLVPLMKRRTSALSPDELESIGNESVVRAVRLFDDSRGVPFEAYAYRFAHLDMKRAILGEAKYQRREMSASFDAAYDHLERTRDTGDLFNDSDGDARRQVTDFAAGIFAVIVSQVLGSSSRAPSEIDIHAKIDTERRQELLREQLAALGKSGDILTLRYFEQLDWDTISSRVGVSLATARRMHDDAVQLLAARLMARRHRNAP